MTVDQIYSLFVTWVRRAGIVCLLALTVLLILKAFGFAPWPIAGIDWQAAGVFVAGAAYALGKS